MWNSRQRRAYIRQNGGTLAVLTYIGDYKWSDIAGAVIVFGLGLAVTFGAL